MLQFRFTMGRFITIEGGGDSRSFASEDPGTYQLNRFQQLTFTHIPAHTKNRAGVEYVPARTIMKVPLGWVAKEGEKIIPEGKISIREGGRLTLHRVIIPFGIVVREPKLIIRDEYQY